MRGGPRQHAVVCSSAAHLICCPSPRTSRKKSLRQHRRRRGPWETPGSRTARCVPWEPQGRRRRVYLKASHTRFILNARRSSPSRRAQGAMDFVVRKISDLGNSLFGLKFFTEITNFDRLLNPILKFIDLACHKGRHSGIEFT